MDNIEEIGDGEVINDEVIKERVQGIELTDEGTKSDEAIVRTLYF
jgi:hypothetical protein